MQPAGQLHNFNSQNYDAGILASWREFVTAVSATLIFMVLHYLIITNILDSLHPLSLFSIEEGSLCLQQSANLTHRFKAHLTLSHIFSTNRPSLLILSSFKFVQGRHGKGCPKQRDPAYEEVPSQKVRPNHLIEDRPNPIRVHAEILSV